MNDITHNDILRYTINSALLFVGVEATFSGSLMLL